MAGEVMSKEFRDRLREAWKPQPGETPINESISIPALCDTCDELEEDIESLRRAWRRRSERFDKLVMENANLVERAEAAEERATLATEALKRHLKTRPERDHLESLLAVAVGAINSILRADVRWRSQNELMFNKQQAERESIASLLKITGLTEQDFAALRIGEQVS